MALENLQPASVFKFFEEICGIPHGSGNVDMISDYLVRFATDRNLEVIQDQEKNVIIKAPGSQGYEDKEPVILQGHMDMVAVKEPDADINMETDGLKVTTDGEYVWAEGTSLGGDDGIAVAYCLALLDDKDIPHPPLEVVITTNEETGMYGAAAIDLSGLKSRKLINIDNEEEGVFIVSCAGGARVYTELDVERENITGIKCSISVSGLLGGHSGEMIKYGRGNANIIVARALLTALSETDINLISIEGGVADNAIPSGAGAQFMVPAGKAALARESVMRTLDELKAELENKDDGISISFEAEEGEVSENAITSADSERILKLICVYPDGVQAMSASVEGLVETSLNLGILKTSGDKINIEQSVRSSVESSKRVLISKLSNIGEAFGAKVTVSGQYPGWKYNTRSEIREHMVAVYRDMYGHDPKVQAIHAGLECGLLSEKIEGLDCISIGPDMQDIHSTGEKLSVKSVANVWDYLKAVLK